MSCPWREEQLQRFAEGSLESQSREDLAAHLDGCAACREKVSEAERLERLLRAGITPLLAPVTLASRVAGAVAVERGRRPRFAWPWLLGRRALSPVLAGLALVLALSVVSYAVAPAAVTALVQRVLIFIPGLGIKPVDEGHLLASGPVVVQAANGTTFTVETLLSDGKHTTVKFVVTGLPGGKQGWDSEPPLPADKQGQELPSGSGARRPFLRDEAGHEYPMATGFLAVGGSPEENRLTGQMDAPPLPGDLRSIELVVPMDYLVPPAVLPGADTQAWVAHIPLVRASESDLPAARPHEATASANGVTLRVTASSVERERTVVLLEGEAEGPARVLALGKPGRDLGDPAEGVALHDDRGRSYRLVPPESGGRFGGGIYRQNLYFPALGWGARELTLEVAAVQVVEKATATVRIPLAGRQPGETWSLDRTVGLGGHQVRLVSARLAEERGGLELYVGVDLGPAVAGRMLSAFQVQRREGSGSMWSMGKDHGAQMDFFGVPVEAGEDEVTIRLEGPIVVVEGPWKVTFPLGDS